MAFSSVIRVLGLLLLGLACAHLPPIGYALTLGEGASAAALALSAGAAMFFGVVMRIAVPMGGMQIGRREAILLAVGGWTVLSLFAAIPFIMTGFTGGYAGAILEATSGFTTTGLTVLPDPGVIDRSLVLWRAMLQWIGGFATFLLVATLIPHIGHVSPTGWAGASSRRVGEVFRPRLRQVARIVIITYFAMSAVCATSLLIAGMPLLDAICYTFAAVSTGGFVPNTGGLAAYSGVSIDLLMVVFMLAGAVNVSLHWAAVTGRPSAYWRDPEAVFMIILVLAALALTVNLMTVIGVGGFGGNMREGLFSVVSAVTTTGFVYGGDTPSHAFIVFMFSGLAVIGGASASTAGGVKLARVLLLVRQSARELERLSHPHGVMLIKIGKTSVSDAAMQGVWTFFIMFLFSLILLAVALSAMGLEFDHALVLAVSALTNCGPVLLDAGGFPTDMSALGSTAHAALAIGMLVGRLEVFTVLVLVTPMFWER